MVQSLFAVGLLLHTAGITLNLPLGKAISPVVMHRERKRPGNFQSRKCRGDNL